MVGHSRGASLGEWEHNNNDILEIVSVFFLSTLQCEKELEQILARTHLVMH